MSDTETSESRPFLEAVRATIGDVTDLDIERDLVRVARWGELSFEEHRGLLKLAVDFVRDLGQLPLDALPDKTLEDANTTLQALHAVFTEIEQYDANALSSPKQQRDSLAAKLRQNLEFAQAAMIPFIGYLSWKATNVEEHSQQLADLVLQAQVRMRDAEDDINKRKAEADSTVKAIQDAAAQTGVAVFTKVFEEEAGRQRDEARRWFLWAVVAGGATLVAGAASLAHVLWAAPGETTAEILQLSLAKAAVLAVGAYATVAFNRTSRAHRHLEAINKHRANALTVFMAFVEAAGDDSTRNAVLLEATHSIFGQSPTGFLDANAEPERVEIIRGLNSLVARD